MATEQAFRLVVFNVTYSKNIGQSLVFSLQLKYYSAIYHKHRTTTKPRRGHSTPSPILSAPAPLHLVYSPLPVIRFSPPLPLGPGILDTMDPNVTNAPPGFNYSGPKGHTHVGGLVVALERDHQCVFAARDMFLPNISHHGVFFAIRSLFVFRF